MFHVTEIPVTPTHQKNFPMRNVHQQQHQQAQQHQHHSRVQYQVYNGGEPSRNDMGVHRRHAEQIHRAISANELDNINQQRRSLDLPTLVPLSGNGHAIYHRKDMDLPRRHSGDLLLYNEMHTGLTPLLSDHQTDFTSLLVSSAGDILMDTTKLPPSNIRRRMENSSSIPPDAVILQHRDNSFRSSSSPLQQQQEESPHSSQSFQMKGSSNDYLVLNDPYSTQPFSPMDTSTCDSDRSAGMMGDRVCDPHLSSSYIHDSNTSLDKCVGSLVLPSNTRTYIRHYGQPLAAASPRHTTLMKSSSQELLSSNSPVVDHSMQVDELDWLDLTLGPPLPDPSSPLQQRASIHSSVGSMLEHDDGGGTLLTMSPQEPPTNSYNLNGGDLTGNSAFTIDLIDSLDINSMHSPAGDPWDGLLSN